MTISRPESRSPARLTWQIQGTDVQYCRSGYRLDAALTGANRQRALEFCLVCPNDLGSATWQRRVAGLSKQLVLVELWQGYFALHYDSSGDDYWNNNPNRLMTNPPSSWYGVTVGSGHVTRAYIRTTGCLELSHLSWATWLPCEILRVP